MSERVTEEDCFNVYWNGEGEMPSHLCAADFARELSLARARVKELEELLGLVDELHPDTADRWRASIGERLPFREEER